MSDHQISDLTRTVRTKVAVCEDEGCECWVWSGACDSSGYAAVKMKGTLVQVHRYAYERLVGPIEMPCEECGGGLSEAFQARDWGVVDFIKECPSCAGTGLDPDATIDHTCTGHRNCINVAHMEVVSRSENSRRANHRRWNEGYSRKDPSNEQ